LSNMDLENKDQMKDIVEINQNLLRVIAEFRDARGGRSLIVKGILRSYYGLHDEADVTQLKMSKDAEKILVDISYRLDMAQARAIAGRTKLETLTFMTQSRSIETSVDRINLRFNVFSECDAQGLLDHGKLFPNGGTHEERRKEVIEFTVQRRKDWEASMKGSGEKEKRIAFWGFLRDSGASFGEDLALWRVAEKLYHGKEI